MAADRWNRDLRALRRVWMAHHPDWGEPSYDALVSFGEHMTDEVRAEVQALLADPGFS